MNRVMKIGAIAAFALLLGSPVIAAEQKTTIKVYGMSCQICANGVAASLKNLQGVKGAEVSVRDAQTVVVYDDQQVTVAQIEQQIENSGFSTRPKSK